jgi:serine/threonine protein kinase
LKFEERVTDLPHDKRKWHEQQFRKKESDFLRARRIRICADDFRTLQVIGKGAFGTVRLVQKIDNGKLYAMKVMRKTEMIKHDQVRWAISNW